AGTGGHALRLYADEPPDAALGCDGRADQRVQLLRALSRDGRGLVLGVAGVDRDLRPQAALAVAHALRDVGGERLGLERLAKDDLVDCLVYDFLEPGHVDTRLARIEVDVALDPGV